MGSDRPALGISDRLLREGAGRVIWAPTRSPIASATGWEPQLTIAVDTVVHMATVMELCAAFFSSTASRSVTRGAGAVESTSDARCSGDSRSCEARSRARPSWPSVRHGRRRRGRASFRMPCDRRSCESVWRCNPSRCNQSVLRRGFAVALARGHSFARRSSCALTATMMVLSDISTAPTAGDSTTPHGASTPAASGIATML